MKLVGAGALWATVGVLFASVGQTSFAAGEIEVTKVNPPGKGKTRTMRIEAAGRTLAVLVDSVPVLTNADIRDVSAVTEKIRVTSGARPETRDVAALRVRFNSAGARKLDALTREWGGKQIGLIIDGKLVATPRLSATIPDGELIFSGAFSSDQSRLMASNINSRQLPPIAEAPERKRKIR